jgi:hypothetical protein
LTRSMPPLGAFGARFRHFPTATSPQLPPHSYLAEPPPPPTPPPRPAASIRRWPLVGNGEGAEPECRRTLAFVTGSGWIHLTRGRPRLGACWARFRREYRRAPRWVCGGAAGIEGCSVARGRRVAARARAPRWFRVWSDTQVGRWRQDVRALRAAEVP